MRVWEKDIDFSHIVTVVIIVAAVIAIAIVVIVIIIAIAIAGVVVVIILNKASLHLVGPEALKVVVIIDGLVEGWLVHLLTALMLEVVIGGLRAVR